MDPLVERAERVFQVWAYSVGMGRLLLRSTKTETFTTRVDVLFQNVAFLNLPTLLEGLLVAEAGAEVGARIASQTGLLPDDDKRIFTIRTRSFVGYVVAGVCVVAEDEGEYYDASSLWRET